jgi:predicted component of type VI protein secretion system
MQTVEQLNNIWYGIVANHYDISKEAWRAVDNMPDTEAEYLTMLIEIATGMIEESGR